MSHKHGKVGRPSKVAPAITAFIDRLREAAPEAYEDLWRQECVSVLERYPLNTQRAYMTQYRNAVRSELGENHPALAIKGMHLLKEISLQPSTDHTSSPNRPFAAPTAFIDKLREAAPEAYEDLWRQECVSVLGKYPLETQKVYLTKYYRQPIRSEFGDNHPILPLMGIKAVREVIAVAATPPVMKKRKTTPDTSIPSTDTPFKRASSSIFFVFAGRLKTAEPNDFERLWQQEWEARKLSNHPVPTQHTYITRYRKAIIDTFGEDHPATKAIKTLKTARSPDDHINDYMTSGRGRPPAFQLQISGVVNAIKDARHTTRGDMEKYYARVRDLWESEFKRLSANHTPASVIKNISAYRTAITTEGLADDELLSIIRAPDELYAEVKKTYVKNLVKRQNQLLPVPNWKKIVETAVSLLPPLPNCSLEQLPAFAKRYATRVDEIEATQIGFALQILTGRRPYEVFCLGKLSPVFSEPPAGSVGKIMDNWHVKFVGQAKTKEREGTKFGIPYTIPVLEKARIILFAWSVLRQSVFGKAWAKINDSETFTNQTLRPTNPAAIYSNIRKELLLPHWPTMPTVKNLSPEDIKELKKLVAITAMNIRSIYAEIADFHFRPKAKTKAAFFAAILGHSDDDLETQGSYMKYYLPDVSSKSAVLTSKRNIIPRLIEDVKANRNIDPLS